jgi:hypothetical protein
MSFGVLPVYFNHADLVIRPTRITVFRVAKSREVTNVEYHLKTVMFL